MKKQKGIIIAIAAIAILSAIVFFVSKKNKGGESLDDVEVKTTSYIVSLTNGYATAYNGNELLFDKKTTIDDLSTENILNTAVKYAVDNLDIDVEDGIINGLELQGYTIDKYTIYNAEAIREAIKELFGIDWDNQSSSGDVNFVYKFIYLEGYDVYLRTASEYMSDDYSQNTGIIEYKVIESKKSKNNIKITVAIAYTDVINNELVYYSDKMAENEVYRTDMDATELDDNKLDSFKKYVITLKNVDGKYVFDSVDAK